MNARNERDAHRDLIVYHVVDTTAGGRYRVSQSVARQQPMPTPTAPRRKPWGLGFVALCAYAMQVAGLAILLFVWGWLVYLCAGVLHHV